MNNTGQNILPFGAPLGDSDIAEIQLKVSLLSAEKKFGPLSGDVGLILLAMVAHYKENSTKAELIYEYEKRIEDIVGIYIEDQITQ